jgi:glycosyltransferase involved in cell wall biosynthesis
MSRPLVSVVIPNHNYARFLPEALDSVLKQTYPEIEILVVDDGSTDDSLDVLRRYHGRMRLFRQPNSGVSRARNLGIRESRGELVAFLDSDDAWLPEKLAKQVDLFESRALGMVYTGLRFVGEDGSARGQTTDGLSGWVLRELALLQTPGVPASGSSAVIRRECFDVAGLFDDALSTSADWDLWRRIACRYEIGMVREPLVSYRLHRESMHRDVELFERDMLLAFERMFADEAASAVHPLERAAKARLFMTLAGSYFRIRRWDKFLRYCRKSLFLNPLGLSRVAGFLFRRRAKLVCYSDLITGNHR